MTRQYNLNATGEALRSEIMEDRWDGTKCPICDANVEIHPFSPNYFMAAGLLLYYIYRPKNGAFTTLTQLANDNDQLLLFWRDGLRSFRRWHLWGMIEQESQFVPNGNNDSWRLSKEGVQFVLGNLAIPRDVITFRGRLIGDGMEADPPGPTVTMDSLLATEPSQDKYRIDTKAMLKSCGKRLTVSPIPTFRKCEQPVTIPKRYDPSPDYKANPMLVMAQLAGQSRPRFD